MALGPRCVIASKSRQYPGKPRGNWMLASLILLVEILVFVMPLLTVMTQINPLPSLNKSLPDEVATSLLLPLSSLVEDLELRLRRSLELRVQNIPEPPRFSNQDGSKLALLFSGGLDCTILARLTHEILPITEPIDLLNVAFENPR